MIRVQITKKLEQKLLQPGSLLTPDLLIDHFTYWITYGETSNAMFGTRTKTEKLLSHTHMAPSDPQELYEWEMHHAKEHYLKLTSDSALLWTQNKFYGCLLIDVIFAPGAHAVWRDAVQVASYQLVAENFHHDGTVA